MLILSLVLKCSGTTQVNQKVFFRLMSKLGFPTDKIDLAENGLQAVDMFQKRIAGALGLPPPPSLWPTQSSSAAAAPSNVETDDTPIMRYSVSLSDTELTRALRERDAMHERNAITDSADEKRASALQGLQLPEPRRTESTESAASTASVAEVKAYDFIVREIHLSALSLIALCLRSSWTWRCRKWTAWRRPRRFAGTKRR